MIFKRKTLPKENVPNGVVVHCQSKGWVDRDGMAVWAEKDGDEDVRGNLKKEHKTTTAVIPGGLTKVLQPLDISVNRSFKAKIREQWEKWMVEGIHTYTATGKMRRASYSEVCEWVLKEWEAIPVTTITNGFRKAGITDTAAVNEDDEDAFREDEWKRKQPDSTTSG